MHLVLSRKGFDSQNGGVPSPILPDGRIVPLPIPSESGPHHIGMFSSDGIDRGALVADLTANRLNQHTKVHFDPDLQEPMLERPSGWRPAFGQVGIAQSHLRNQAVGPGDVFLFFGWFRRMERHAGVWRYVPGSPQIHALFGWLQIDDVLPVTGRVAEVRNGHPGLCRHPHIENADRFESLNNTVYVGSQSLVLGGTDTGRPGAGVFSHWMPSLQLTADGEGRSCWRLPAWFQPRDQRPALSYHGTLSRWREDGDSVILRTVAKGQEFVLDCEHYPEATGWLTALFSESPPIVAVEV